MEPEYYRHSRKKTSSLKVGFIVGALWAVVQFGISEVSYRIALETDNDLLYDISDLVAWPAGELYHSAEIELYQETLNGMEAEAEEREAWDALIVRAEDPDDFEAYDALWVIFDEHSLEPYVDIETEYKIYIGICIMWGFAVGVAATTSHFILSGV